MSLFGIGQLSCIEPFGLKRTVSWSKSSSRMDPQVKSDPESEQYGASQPDDTNDTTAGNRDRDGGDSQQSKKNPVRKRTKTGCLSMSNRR